MNHLDQDETPDWNDDIDALENQLRSLRPTPARSWDSISEAIEESLDQSSAVSSVPQSLATSRWKPIISHAVTAAIGLAVGVAVMLIQSPSDPGLIDATGNSDSSTSPVQLVDAQVPEAPNKDQPIASDLQPSDAPVIANKTLPNRRRLSQASWKSTRLRAFGVTNERLVNGRDWSIETDRDHGFTQPEEPDADNSQFDQPDGEPIDNPILSPGSFRQVVDELTYSSTSSNPFSKFFAGGWLPPRKTV